jgi:hypothetical protein
MLAGKNDEHLTRLKQYKVLEQRKRDEETSQDNSAFLRSSDIRVTLDYDVESNIGRAVELINRTNQLNFTKRRLPEDAHQAANQLLHEIRPFYRQAALIRVVDRYGDYGYCGFFLRDNGQGEGAGTLIHYCFSCRTLGMSVEHWVYDQLGRPQLNVAKPVLTDIFEIRDIDWIRLFIPAQGETIEQARPIPEVRLRGGCEMDALAHYFGPYTPRCHREGSLRRGPFFVTKDCSHHLATPSELPLSDDFIALAEKCGFIRPDFESEIFAPCDAGSLLIYSSWGDIRPAYKHRASGRLLTALPRGIPNNVMRMSYEEVNDILVQCDLPEAEYDLVRSAVVALQGEAEWAGHSGEDEAKQHLRRVFSAVPDGCKIAILALDEYWKNKGEPPISNLRAATYNSWLSEIAVQFGAMVFAIGDYVESEDERESTGHFDRIVYYRLASAIISWAIGEAKLAQAA